MIRKKSSQGSILKELRRVRESLWREYHGDHARLSRDAKKIAKGYGMKYSRLRPVARCLKELAARRKKSNLKANFN